MTLAADVQQLRAVFTLEDAASGPANRIKTTMAGLGSASGGATKSLGLAERGLTGIGNAASHAKGFLGNLITGPAGMLALGVASLGVAGIFEKSISTALDEASALEKLTAITGESATSLSALIAVGDKYGISSAAITTAASFAEKTIGKLSETYTKAGKAVSSARTVQLEDEKLKLETAGASTKLVDKLLAESKARDALTAATTKAGPPISKLMALDKQYGINLVDSTGHAVDFETELNRVSDYYTSNATAGQKAALAATLFGRGYATMIPILQLGSAGIKEAEASAAALGLTLNATNVSDLMKFQDSMRSLKEAAGGLALQLSLALLPELNTMATTLAKFVGDHRTDIVAFFRNTVNAAEAVGGALVSVGQGLAGLWNRIPGPMQTLLVEALVGNKVIKTVFGINIMGSVEGAIGTGIKDLLGKAFGGLLQRGGTPANPLFVADVAGGGGIGGVASGAAGIGAKTIGGVALSTIAVAAAAAIAAAVAVKLGIDFANQSAGITKQGQSLVATSKSFAGGASTQQLQSGIAVINAQEADGLNKIALAITNPFNHGQDTLDATKAVLQARLDAILKQGGDQTRADELTAQDIVHGNNLASTTAEILQTALGKIIGLTQDQRDKILASQALMNVAIRSSGKLTYDQLVKKAHADHLDHLSSINIENKEFAKAADILKSNETTKQKIIDLNAIQSLFSKRGDVASAEKIKMDVATLLPPLDTIAGSIGALMKLQNTKDQGSSVHVPVVAVTTSQNTAKHYGPTPSHGMGRV